MCSHFWCSFAVLTLKITKSRDTIRHSIHNFQTALHPQLSAANESYITLPLSRKDVTRLVVVITNPAPAGKRLRHHDDDVASVTLPPFPSGSGGGKRRSALRHCPTIPAARVAYPFAFLPSCYPTFRLSGCPAVSERLACRLCSR